MASPRSSRRRSGEETMPKENEITTGLQQDALLCVMMTPERAIQNLIQPDALMSELSHDATSNKVSCDS